MRRRAFLATLAASLAGACLPDRLLAPEPSPKARPGTPLVGVTIHRIDPPTLLALRDLGVGHVRTTLYPNGDRLSHPSGDEALSRLATEFDVLCVVRGSLESGAVEDAVRRFPGVAAWQVGNEVDVDGAASDRFADYPAVLARVAGEVRRANARVAVVAAGLAGDGSFAGSLVPGSYDVLAVHAYGFPVATQFAAKASLGSTVWCSETGLEAAVVPGSSDWERVQAEQIADVLERNDRERLYPRVYLYVLSGDAHALVRDDGTPRPAYRWLRDYLSRPR